MGNEWEVLFTVFILSSWFLFPLGMFLSVGRLDKDTDQLTQLEVQRHEAAPLVETRQSSHDQKAA